VEPIRHLESRGRPEARRFRVRLGAIPYAHLDPRMGLKPLRHGRGFPVGEEGQGPPPGEVQQESARGVALPQGEIVHADDWRRADRRVGRAADDAQPRVATHRASEMPAEPHPGRPTQRQADGAEAGRQPPCPPGPRACHTRQSLGEEATCAGGLAAEELTDAARPCDPVATPREIGQRPSVAAVDIPRWNMAPWASRRCLCG
jgi:hypothetical protein